MEGRINNLGNLLIKRGNEWVLQLCCHDQGRPCRHTCPAFGSAIIYGRICDLSLCNQMGVIRFHRFWDDRLSDSDTESEY
jgi:hypothetical protein